ncbi:DUF2809 domain-containing protein [Massilia glaciei]|uniref:DUF2809 domain-containing protein n=2 Tax=Massilia glaciei TaxID=1524097 RepID=A0A2U2I6L1_9BURK|nr:DUF2809 domain-containing protein [Massilia glaciei]
MAIRRIPGAEVRNRRVYGLATIAVIAFGLASREYPGLFPPALEKYPGDALWALMLFAAYCTLLPKSAAWRVAALALCTSFAVELSQLYQAPFIIAVRATTLGHLVLGSTFNRLDLVAYTIGVAAGAAIDSTWLTIAGKARSTAIDR